MHFFFFKGNVMRQWGEYGEALELFKKSLRIKTERLGNDHEDVANTLHNIAVILDETNKHRLALDCYKEVCTRCNSIYLLN